MSLKNIRNRCKDLFKDRRKCERILVDLPFEYWTQYNPHVRSGGIVLDASGIGLLIHSIEDMPVNTQLMVAVLYIQGYGLTNLGVWAEIVWKNVDEKGEYLYGLKFVEVSKKDHNKLMGILRRNLLKPIINKANKSKWRKERSMVCRPRYGVWAKVISCFLDWARRDNSRIAGT
jgi:hypothetical protein